MPCLAVSAVAPDPGAVAGGWRTMDANARTAKKNPLQRLRASLNALYNGRSLRAERFRYSLLTFDLVTVGIFIIDSLTPPIASMIVVDVTIAVLLILDFSARLLIARPLRRYLLDPVTIADVVVIATLLLPLLIENWAFLRILRALRLLRSYRVLRDLRRRFRFFARNQQLIQALANLLIFVFVVTAFVFITQQGKDSQIESYIDALYFTVTTLTTTGFGDVVLKGEAGRLLAIVIMLGGFGLFLRLVQSVFRPRKVEFRCPDCGLLRHDFDAVHCKHCGRVLNIESEDE
jgi:voltage-gated potassium channel